MNIFYIIISGVSVFLLGQILQNFVLEPIRNLKIVIAKIDNKLKYYSNILTNSGFKDEVVLEITDIMRSLSCDLESNYKQIPFKRFFVLIRVVPKKESISTSASELIYLSNAGGRHSRDRDVEIKNSGAMDKIRLLLNIKKI